MPSSASQLNTTQPNANHPEKSTMRRCQKRASPSLAGRMRSRASRGESSARLATITARSAMNAARKATTAARVRGGQSKARKSAALPMAKAASAPSSRANRSPIERARSRLPSAIAGTATHRR